MDELIAPDTVNTMPEATLDAVADHGRVLCRHRMERYYADAQRVRDYLNWFEISYPELLETLEQDGLERFDTSWAELLDEIAVQLDKRR
nr:transaldolase family protein [Saccharothrix sp. ST-888]